MKTPAFARMRADHSLADSLDRPQIRNGKAIHEKHGKGATPAYHVPFLPKLSQ